MAFTGPALCNSWKRELFDYAGFKASGGDTFKAALYNNTATLTKATTAFPGNGVGGELAATGGYVQGGAALTNVDAVLSGDTAFPTFANVSWVTATFTTYGALVYNVTKSNKAVMVLDFGGAKIAIGGTFTIQWPVATASTAIIRLT